MSSTFEHALVIGATSGIGHALATRLVEEGSKVTVVGRRQGRLDAFVKEHGSDKASAATFDLENLDRIPGFINKCVESIIASQLSN